MFFVCIGLAFILVDQVPIERRVTSLEARASNLLERPLDGVRQLLGTQQHPVRAKGEDVPPR